jgi:dTDP-4-amino-4,6-dideoxygalactose transaminase
MLLTDDEAIYERAICLGDIMRIIELDGPSRRFAATSFGIKTRMAPLSAAVARVQLTRLAERNARRNHNLSFLSAELEQFGFQTFLPPTHIERVYFEYLIRCPDDLSLPVEKLIEALRAEGCEVDHPRYPLLHQQPLFTEGLFGTIGALAGRDDLSLPDYCSVALPRTERENERLIKLPSFPFAERPLLDQYINAFQKVMNNTSRIAEPRLFSAP